MLKLMIKFVTILLGLLGLSWWKSKKLWRRFWKYRKPRRNYLLRVKFSGQVDALSGSFANDDKRDVGYSFQKPVLFDYFELYTVETYSLDVIC